MGFKLSVNTSLTINNSYVIIWNRYIGQRKYNDLYGNA